MMNPLARYGINTTKAALQGRNLAQESRNLALKLGVDMKTLQDRLSQARASGLDLSKPEIMKKAVLGDFKSAIVPYKYVKKESMPTRDSFTHLTSISRLNKTVAGDKFDAGDVLRRGTVRDIEINTVDDMKVFQYAVNDLRKNRVNRIAQATENM